jgi:AraC-like DNA-binding protein
MVPLACIQVYNDLTNWRPPKVRKIKQIENIELSEALARLGRRIEHMLGDQAEKATAVPGLSLYCSTAPTPPLPCSYEPSLLVIPQGTKRIELGRSSYLFGQTTFLLTSVELPIVSRVVNASKQAPYLAFFFKFQIATVRDILNQEEIELAEPPSGPAAMAIGKTTVELADACLRLVNLLDQPADIPFMGKLIGRELIYRLLQSDQGERLRSIATLGDQTNRTAKAVSWLRTNYDKPLRVEELATLAGMGLSTLHHHFRALTSMSPLQFQKQLRLRAARNRMLTEEIDAATAAFEVGYESPSQFNREYKRFFGKPPIRDVQDQRSAEH